MAAPLSAAVIVTPNGGTDTANPSGTYVYGWEFNVNSQITVDHLAIYDSGLDGLAESHDIGIWNPAGALLLSATIASGTGTVLDGLFRLVDVSNTVLAVGSGYVIAATNFDVDLMRVNASYLTIGPEISFVESRFLDTGGSLDRPTNSIGSLKYFGPSFTVIDSSTAVPIPATLALFGLGLAILGWSRRNKRS
ncbi:PEP-CTERM sorting domain-containing protein [Parahaliea sp. F7430]|uniref:PEP-CTERM sorting domain-containing protein n=2 Tax=Sediminihaliea albiluteola TaxID=2758564 RepID=A0A7W2TUC1_9GAMM|nr:PEP-CTERM sorting domain-containing protein [Sediminihaliea albiluteola]